MSVLSYVVRYYLSNEIIQLGTAPAHLRWDKTRCANVCRSLSSWLETNINATINKCIYTRHAPTVRYCAKVLGIVSLLLSLLR
jgi:hypothetical protein